VTHTQAFTRLPDLLDDRDDPELLAHVQACGDCQRQLFLLSRVDRLLHDHAATHSPERPRPWRYGSRALLAAAAAAAVAVAVVLLAAQPRATHALTFHTGAGEAVGQAVMAHSDAHNLALKLNAHHLPVSHGQMFILWATSDTRASMQVGRFMVDRHGNCHVRFNLPANHTWAHLWITRPNTPNTIIAST
jgi:anti-sigma-K factor RskA